MAENYTFEMPGWSTLFDGLQQNIQEFTSVTIILAVLFTITSVYMVHVAISYMRKEEPSLEYAIPDNIASADDLLKTASCPYISPEVGDDMDLNLSDEKDIFQAIHHAAARVNIKKYEDKCIGLLQICPDAVNYPMPPLKFTPFLRACWWGNTRVVEYMLRHGADITSTTKDGDTPIYLAVYRATKSHHRFDPSCINALYDAGCNINTQHYHGYTPLHLAARNGDEKLVLWLLVHGANPDLVTKCNKKPVEVAKRYGCDINTPKFHGYTPLHLAAKTGNVNLVRWLLVHGADPDCLTKGNKKPVDIANGHGHRKVVALLTVRTGEDRKKKRSPGTRRKLPFPQLLNSNFNGFND